MNYKRHNDLMDDDIVISGMSLRLPKAYNVQEFADNLYNKEDCTTPIEERYGNKLHPDMPARMGFMPDVNNFDAGFFGISYRVANYMEPMCRLVLKRTYEAILDAGMHPSDFEGKRTAIFVAASFFENENVFYSGKIPPKTFCTLEAVRSVVSGRLSYWLKTNGKCAITDSACANSMYAMEHAYKALKYEDYDYALVVGGNLCLNQLVTMQFSRLGVLSKDCSCKPFDDNANGYLRSEGIVVAIMEKGRTAKRIYAKVLHVKVNCDGYKSRGITFPSSDGQKALLVDCYSECGVDPSTVTYLEAHGTGTHVGDPVELNTIDEVFCTGRKLPLHIGSVKSNIGHTESAAGLCGIFKLIIGFQTGLIPPNINFNTPRQNIKGFVEKKIIVVTDPINWPSDDVLVGVNSFGFGGANGHSLIGWYKKTKLNNGLPGDNLPRLVCVSGRTEESLFNIINDLNTKNLDEEYVALYHNIFRKPHKENIHRGYIILSKDSTLNQFDYCISEENCTISMYFGAENDLLPKSLQYLLDIPIFSRIFQDIKEIFKKNRYKFDFDELIQKFDNKNLLHVVLGTVIYQICVAETFKALKITFNNIYAVGIGIFAKSYLENILTLDEASFFAYFYATQLKDAYINLKINNDKFRKNLNNYLAEKKKVLNANRKEFIDWLLGQNLNGIKLPSNSYFVGCGKLVHKVDENKYISLVENLKNVLINFFIQIGKLYNLGMDFDLSEIYPKVNFPVPRGTPMISSLIKWNHTKNYRNLVETKKHDVGITIQLNNIDWAYIQGHVIDGRNLFPAIGFLYCVWDLYASINACMPKDISVIFRDIKFIRALNLRKDREVTLCISILPESGEFEVSEGDMVMVTGRILKMKKTDLQINLPNYIDEELPLKEKDIYKELRLRNYDYSGLFKGIVECNLDATKAKVEWKNNWVAYLDNLLQVFILKKDTRSLYVPSGIEKLSIDVKAHYEYIETQKDAGILPVYTYHEAGIIRSAGVEVLGLNIMAISKRRLREEPVLESNRFIPNMTNLNIDESITVNMQLILENVSTVKVKVAEVYNENMNQQFEPLAPHILNSLKDIPLIQPDITVYTQNGIQVDGVNIERRPVIVDETILLIIGIKLLENKEKLVDLSSSLKHNGFILTREVNSTDISNVSIKNLSIITIHNTGNEKFVLLHKNAGIVKSTFVDLSESLNNFDWLSILQKYVEQNENVIVYSQDEPVNGILGLVNCLRKETGATKMKALLLDASAPKFDANSNFYKEQLNKGLAINVFKDGRWGTFRYLLLTKPIAKEMKHCYVNVTVPGNLSSLTWFESPLNQNFKHEIVPILIHYSALNFRDVLMASGRIAADIGKNRIHQQNQQGFEYSGVDENGFRVMGITNSGALATQIVPDRSLLWRVPDQWSLSEAATVPVVYCTSLFAMLVVGKLKQGESILIHSGTGGIGLAAINIALFHQCTIFTTVGTEEKKKFILKHFPQIPETHIGNSRDTTFEEMVKIQTNGRGVDLVLNSLAEEKLQASVRCLAPRGRFLEIGRFDLASNNALFLEMLSEGKTFNGIMLDNVIRKDAHAKKQMHKLLKTCIAKGMVKPLQSTIFHHSEVEQAFRYMTTGKHMGKVLINIRNYQRSEILPKCLPRYYSKADSCTIIVGGLGGFGLELADWLVIRGTKKLILTSRTGITNGYQALRIKIWNIYGTEVIIRTDDITTEAGCLELLKAATEFGTIENIFNLAVVLRNKSFENQTAEDFQILLAPKAFATQYLDKLTRKMCPELGNFVIFSSITGGRGSAGQTNYGMANSVTERICEQRKKDGYPALAIQWGLVGDVGLVAESMNSGNEMVFKGTVQQKISSCLDVFDILINQCEPIVSSTVIAEKLLESRDQNIIDVVANILGIRDIKTVSPHTTLPELGMDSMMGVEIKQTLEREYYIFLTPQDVRNLTFARLQEIFDETENSRICVEQKTKESSELLLRFIIDESESQHTIIKMDTKSSANNVSTIFLLPGYEGTSTIFKYLCNKMKVNATCFQYAFENHEDSITDMARNLLPKMVAQLNNSQNFLIVAYSFGTLVALELTSMLEELGYVGKLILIDGAPNMTTKLVNRHFPNWSPDELQITLLFRIFTHIFSMKKLLEQKDDLIKCETYEDKVNLLTERLPPLICHSKRYQKLLAISLYKRLLAMKNYKPSFSKIRAEVHLYKPKIHTIEGLEEDFGLSDLCHQNVQIKYFDGDHVSILENEEIAEEINKQLDKN